MFNWEAGKEKVAKAVNFLANLTLKQTADKATQAAAEVADIINASKPPEGYVGDEPSPNNQHLDKDPAKEALDKLAIMGGDLAFLHEVLPANAVPVVATLDEHAEMIRNELDPEGIYSKGHTVMQVPVAEYLGQPAERDAKSPFTKEDISEIREILMMINQPQR